MSFPVAVSSYCFQTPIQSGYLNLFGYLEIIHSRYKVQQADISNELLPAQILEPEFLVKIHNFIFERDMTLACLCIDGPELWSDDPDKRHADRQLIQRYLEAARRLNTKAVRIQLGRQAGGEGLKQEAFEDIVIQMREWCEYYGDYGMRIGPENSAGIAWLPANLKKIRDAVDHPAYGHLLRVGSWPAGKGREMIETCLPSLMHTHLPAESIIWVKDLLRRIARTDYDGAYSIVQSCNQYELIRAEWQINVLRGLIAELKQEGLENVTPPGYFCQMAKAAPPDGILDL
jgi:sugar phosphate isomerase/epimerase